MILTNLTIKNNVLIVPSNFWRDYIIKNFQVSPNQITTTHEAVDPTFLEKIDKLDKLHTKKPKNYIIYTGNLYPHKNIDIIIKALKNIPNLKLKIICARNSFTKRIEKIIKKYQIKDQVEFLGYIPDTEFKKIYNQALALVHPSFMEGFSLTGLEAMALDCPVISSDSSCLPEIYQKSVLYFDPKNPNELITQIEKLQGNQKLRQKLIELGHKQVAKYSWAQTAKLTLNVYKKNLT
jgi:glycosyltransferase involved in cell wall biosynthesis